jgi:hypothetical protein
MGMSISKINHEASDWFAGRQALPSWLHKPFSPLESREFGASADALQPGQGKCTELESVLQGLSLQRMVVGHTLRSEGISSGCGHRVWRIDVGLAASQSEAGQVGAAQVLEIVSGGARAAPEIRVLQGAVKMPGWAEPTWWEEPATAKLVTL